MSSWGFQALSVSSAGGPLALTGICRATGSRPYITGIVLHSRAGPIRLSGPRARASLSFQGTSVVVAGTARLRMSRARGQLQFLTSVPLLGTLRITNAGSAAQSQIVTPNVQLAGRLRAGLARARGQVGVAGPITAVAGTERGTAARSRSLSFLLTYRAAPVRVRAARLTAQLAPPPTIVALAGRIRAGRDRLRGSLTPAGTLSLSGTVRAMSARLRTLSFVLRYRAAPIRLRLPRVRGSVPRPVEALAGVVRVTLDRIRTLSFLLVSRVGLGRTATPRLRGKFARLPIAGTLRAAGSVSRGHLTVRVPVTGVVRLPTNRARGQLQLAIPIALAGFVRVSEIRTTGRLQMQGALTSVVGTARVDLARSLGAELIPHVWVAELISGAGRTWGQLVFVGFVEIGGVLRPRDARFTATLAQRQVVVGTSRVSPPRVQAQLLQRVALQGVLRSTLTGIRGTVQLLIAGALPLVGTLRASLGRGHALLGTLTGTARASAGYVHGQVFTRLDLVFFGRALTGRPTASRTTGTLVLAQPIAGTLRATNLRLHGPSQIGNFGPVARARLSAPFALQGTTTADWEAAYRHTEPAIGDWEDASRHTEAVVLSE